MAGGKVHQHRHAEIGDEIEHEILELVFLGTVEREVAEDDAAHLREQPRGAQLHEPLVDERHRIADLLEEEDRVGRVDLVGRADRLLHEREVAADEASRRAARAAPRGRGRGPCASRGAAS